MATTTKLEEKATHEAAGYKKEATNGATLFLFRLSVLVAFLIIWELASTYYLDVWFYSKPSLVGYNLYTLFKTARILSHLYATLSEMFGGLLIGCSVGISIGLLFSYFKYLAKIVDPYIFFLYALPKIALAPLFIVWFGIGIFSKIMVAFSMVVFICLLNIIQGTKEVDRVLIDLMRSMKASKRDITVKVVFPSIFPWIFASVKLSVGMSLIGAVVGEFISANIGIGWYISYSAAMFNISGVFAGLIILGLVAGGLSVIINMIERRIFVWRAEALT